MTIIIMLNSRLQKWLPTANLLWQRVFAGFSHYAVKEVRGDYVYVLEDSQQELQYMREVETKDGRRGIVLKIQQLSTTYVAMYHPIPKAQQASFQIANKNIPWQASVEGISQAVKANQRGIYNVNGKSVSPVVANASGGEGSGECLVSLSPLLDVCYDLQYGGLFHFTGCLGSRKTSTLATILQQFNKKQKHVGVYFSAASQQEANKAAESGSVVLSGQGRQKQTDVGVYMLALKAIQLGNLLRKDGKQVLVGLDNFKQVLQAEWHMLQMLSNTALRQPGQMINYNAPKLAPISLLNQLYAGCGRGAYGSLTGVIVTEGKGKNDDLMPEITPYSNNLKHLASLSHVVQFPVSVRHNYRTTPLQVDPYTPQPLPLLIRALRQHINIYLREKQESDLKRKLYKSDMREAPWDYYTLLDAEWWLEGLQRMRANSEEEERQYLQWLLINIEGELISHWKLPCNEAYAHFAAYLQREGVSLSGQTIEAFVGWAKLQGLFSAFKKDYLH